MSYNIELIYSSPIQLISNKKIDILWNNTYACCFIFNYYTYYVNCSIIVELLWQNNAI